MSVVFQCPNCGVERTAARFIQGHRVRCPGCDRMVDVPVVSDSEDLETIEEEEDLPVLGDDVGELTCENEQVSPIASVPPSTNTAPAQATFFESTAVDGEPEPDGKVKLREKRELVDAEMDMTPMVDVTFLLLIFFMVTAVFVLQKSLQIPKPDPPEENVQARSFQELEENPDYVTVHVEPLGTYRVVTADWDVDVFSEAELLRKLQEARRGVAGGQIPTHLLVRADGDAGHGKVVAALDAGTAVGMEDVQLLTVEDEGSEN